MTALEIYDDNDRLMYREYTQGDCILKNEFGSFQIFEGEILHANIIGDYRAEVKPSVPSEPPVSEIVINKSLIVAQIMWPMHEWEISNSGLTVICETGTRFMINSDESLGREALWIRKNSEKVQSAIELGASLDAENPYEAIADVVIKIGKERFPERLI